MTHFWTSITSFYNVRKLTKEYTHVLRAQPIVKYKAKCKLHGTNAGIVIEPSGRITVLSREAIITPTSDNAGFAKWVETQEEHFLRFVHENDTIVLYGEWCGSGIQKGTAINQIGKKIFAIFACKKLNDENLTLEVEPAQLQKFANHELDCYVIPWFNEGEEFSINWNSPSEELQDEIDKINKHIESIERCDPWIKEMFNVEGLGEGLVMYPVSNEHKNNYECFSNLGFKAKGEKHKVVAKTAAVQLDPTIAANLDEFVNLVVTPARLEQAVQATSGNAEIDIANIGQFLAWINKDIIKETQTELQASGLDQKLAIKHCQHFAREWFLTEYKKL